METNLLKGNLELILLNILEDQPKYGLEIINEAKSSTDGYFDFKEGSLYPVLHRLQKGKYLAAEMQASDSGGPPRRYYRITEKGHKLLAKKREGYERFNKAMRTLWGS